MRTILISGASRGIGRKVAEKLLAEGNRLSIGIRDSTQFKASFIKTAKANEQDILFSNYEAKEKDSAMKWVQRTKDHFGQIDTLIHCAGKFANTQLLFPDEKENEIEDLWKINLLGPWYLTRAAWPHLIKEQSPRIITLVSMSGKRSKGNLAAYSATKFALMGLCQTMRNEGWESGIRVTALCPSWVNTDMAAEVNSIPKEEMTQPEDIASICSNILLLPNSSVPFEIALNCSLEI